MSIKIMSLIWSDHTGALTPTEKMVLLRMADFAADDGSSIYPSLNRVAKDTSLSRRTVIRNIQSLIEKGVLIKVCAASPQDYISATYRIEVSHLEWLKRSSDFVSSPPSSSQLPSDRVSPPLVTECHPPSDRVSPNPSYNTSLTFINKKILSKDSIQKGHERFEEWWEPYPKKTGKLAAKEKFLKALKHTDAETLIQGALMYAKVKSVTKDEKFIKNPATWLNQGCWEDDYSTTKLPFEVYRKMLKAQIEKEGYVDDEAKAQYAYRMEIAKENGEYVL